MFEPNGTHVYYMINSSENGRLDRQNTNYIKEGNYTVKVNIFAGYFSSYYSWYIYVTLVYGENIFTSALDISNSSALGEAGNDNPKFTICTVNVKKNAETGKYETKMYDTFSIN